MLKAKIVRNVFEFGTVYGTKGDIVVLPDHIAKAHGDRRKKDSGLELVGAEPATEKEVETAAANHGVLKAASESSK